MRVLITLLALFTFACGGAPAEVTTVSPSHVEPAVQSASPVATAPVEPAPHLQPVECTQVGMLDVSVPQAAYDQRHGVAATRFSELDTKQLSPLEECGLMPTLLRLISLTCDDGTNPFAGNPRTAHASRVGNTGPGGRCGAIVDLYQVPCPEGNYDVHSDMYFCPPSVERTNSL